MQSKTEHVDNYCVVRGLENAESITNFRQSVSCFNAQEVNPAVGCDFRCRYCSMYAQMKDEEHLKMRIYKDYPEYLREYIRKSKDKESLIFNFSPKTDAFSPSLIETGVTEAILRIFHEENVRYYIITKGGLPPKDICDLLIKAKDRNQVIISSGLPDERLEAVLEPGAPPSSKRYEFAKYCLKNGVVATGLVAPYLPIEDGDVYAKNIFTKYQATGLKHASLQVLKVSVECLKRLCELLPEHEQKLNQMFDRTNAQTVEWKLPGGKTVTRFFADSRYLKNELPKLKVIAKSMGITVSTCKDVCANIDDLNFNDDGLKHGYNCVGFTRAFPVGT